ncbi:MAG TPA: ABC transporter substrate-binding protein [Usitatibacter sp.]|nr:ABC transporter substrate-binding protein [Usitatibacter sp.]
MTATKGISRRTVIKGALAGAATGIAGFPFISYGQSDVIRVGHLTPRTGFLGPLGEFAVQAMDMAVAEINAAGGVLGRKIELLKEDSVNPQTATTKAERMVERDKVACLVGEISSASGLAISQVAERTKTLFINTGCNSDELRGKGCKKYMFHIESQNSMYVKTCGRSLLQDGMVKGRKWFSLTADYAFGHDLLRVAKRFMEANGGQFAADKLVPTDATDFSPLLLEIRSAKPDLVISNLAGNQITNFIKQYVEFGLDYPVAGFGFDTALAWAAGKGNFLGTWPLVWHHMIQTPASQKFVADFRKRYNRPPENQAWGDYNAMKLIAQAMVETKSTDSTKLVEHFEKGARFPLMKTRDGYFRKADHQMMHEMYTVKALAPQAQKNDYDLFTSSGPIPGANEPLEIIAATAEENECRMA